MNFLVIVQSLLIFISIFFPTLFASNPNLEPYSLQACGVIVLVYIAFKKLLRPEYQSISSMLFIMAFIQILVISTGKTSSPLFFLYYFVLFALSVTFEKYLVFFLTAITISSYLYLQPNILNDFNQSTANLLSLLLITPLANYYSKAVIKNSIAKEKIKLLQEDLSQTETDSLLWLTTENKPTLSQVINSVTDIIIYLKSTRSQAIVPKPFLDKIRAIQSDLMTLYSSADLLEDNLKTKTDNSKK
ncbi:hypothetical protein A2572_03730 [Candidatus Collierbacteria bacterium RIFOXYD1_FULL_40_9]|uniref:Uncharacterized protein n=1 Tax=Candidatus Collierbacteria bacterium RIFOXYD1_FULL_40_9 TaxID=1817731 RepID=A0A1F5FTH2_9BACT|nr:MAG: hypothetical protein A2572_03730 [Candidatus Collierbacteria bacterium RIFOXYD1_FULL_40_9]